MTGYADFVYLTRMKWGKVHLIWALLCMGTGWTSAQTTADCAGAVVLCNDWYSEENASFDTGEVFEYTGMCNAGTEYPSVWYTFTVQEDGLLSFILTPAQVADDYDWAVFNITDGGCEGISAGGASPEVECNSFGEFGNNGATGISTAMGGTGTSNGPGNANGPAFNADLPVTAGEVYALVVMNWTQSPYGYTLDFGLSSATLYDGDPPGFADVTAPCDLSEFTVVLTEPVLLSSVELADFAVFGPGGVQVDLAQIAPIAPAGGQCDAFTLTLSNPITQSGAYNVLFTDVAGSVEDGCGNLGTGQFDLQLTALEAPIGWDEYAVVRCIDEPVLLQVPEEQPAGTQWSWYYDEGGNMAPEWLADGGAWMADLDGVYWVMLDTDPPCFGASGSIAVTSEDCGLFIPNVISPNGDYVNAAFRIDGLDHFAASRIAIWDRWGALVFEHADFGHSAGWSPALEGPIAATEGTYYYELVIPRGTDPVQIEDATGIHVDSGTGDLRLTGEITVVR